MVVQRSLFGMFVFTLIAGGLQGQTSPDQTTPRETIKVITRAVVLDIAVVDDKGRPAKGLMKGDFSLLEDGVPQTLTSFEEHDASAMTAQSSPARNLPPNTYTNLVTAPENAAGTVLLLDALDTSIPAQMYLHEQIAEYMKHFPAGTSMAIFALDTRMHLLQGFTTDPQILQAALQDHRAEPHFGGFETGSPYDRAMRHDILVQGMKELGRYLAGFPGRKNLIWFTSFIPHEIYGTGASDPFRDVARFDDQMRESADILSLSRVAVYPVDARGLVAPMGGSQPHLGLAEETGRESLDRTAEATGGKAFYNTNGLKDAIAEVVQTGSDYYTVSYTPSNRDWNGEMRHIRVHLNQPGLHLEYRHGYRARNREQQEQRHLATVQRRKVSGRFTPASEEAPPGQGGILLHRGTQESLQASMTLGAIPPTELLFDATVTGSAAVQKADKKHLPPDNYLRPSFAGKPYREYDVLFSLDMHRISLEPGTDGLHHGQADFVAVVYNDAGDVVNSLITTLSYDLQEPTFRRMLASGQTLDQKIAVPVKGTYYLRLGVRDVAGDHVGAMEIPVSRITVAANSGPVSP